MRGYIKKRWAMRCGAKFAHRRVRIAFGGDEEYEGLGSTFEEAFENLVEKLNSLTLPELCSELDRITNDPKLYNLLKEGFGDGDFADIKMSVNQGSLPVKLLIPLQREIGLDNSLKFPLQSDCSTYFNSPVTIVAPIVTYNGNFIVDGHHRWSQLYMVNPEAEITAIDFAYSNNSPLRILRNFQGAIAVAEGEVPSQVVGLADVFSMGESEIRSYVEGNISDACVEGLMNLAGLADEEEVIDYIVENAMELKQDNPPYGDAPERKDMPQTTPEAIQVAEEGQTNL